MNARPTRRRTRAAAVSLLAATAVVCLGATSASAAPGFAFSERTGGATRVETAVATSQTLYPEDGSATDVVLVNLSATVDGLSASYLAGLKNAPILYTDTDAVPSATAAEIKRLGVEDVWLVGGTSRISADEESDLKGSYTVHRFAGEDRYGTAAAVAEAGPYQPERVYITSGTSLADAVTVGPVAWARNYPVLLTDAHSVPKYTSDSLAKLGVANRTVVGGTAVVDQATYGALGGTARLGGADRQSTAVLVADDAVATADFTHENAALVGGMNSNAVDALSASALAGATGTPLLYTTGVDTLGDVTTKYLKDNSEELEGIGFVFGGTSAVGSKAVDQANTAAQ